MTLPFAFGTAAPHIEACKSFVNIEPQNKRKRAIIKPQFIELDQKWRGKWPVRDQYGRGTCVSFGVCAALELSLANELDIYPTRISEEFIHHRMQIAHPLPRSEQNRVPKGVFLLKQAMLVLEEDGFLESYALPYRSRTWVSYESYPDEVSLLMLASKNKRKCLDYGRRLGPSLSDPRYEYSDSDPLAKRFFKHLKGGHPVVIGVPMFPHDSGLSNWTLPQTMANGIVYCPEDENQPNLRAPRTDGHVVCLTGFIPDENEPLGGWFVFKNSWGCEFGTHNGGFHASPYQIQRGFGVISATHIDRYCWEYLVPSNSQEASF